MSRLAIGEHEEMQAEALLTSSGSGLRHKGLAYKVSDMSAGYKPYDGFMLGYGTVARFFMAWSCRMASQGRVYAVAADWMEERARNAASVTEEGVRAVGEVVDVVGGV